VDAAPRAKRPFAGIPPNVVWLGVVSFLNDCSSEMIFPLLPLFFTAVLGGSPAALGAMEGLVESVASLVKLWSGRLGDRLRRRKPLVVTGYSLASVTRPLIALTMAPWQVIGLRVVDRVGKGMRGAPRDALIADSVEAGIRGRAFGFHRSMDHLGAIAGPVTALVLIPLLFGPGHLQPAAYRVLFGIAAVPAAVSVLVLLLLVHEPPRHHHAHATQPADTRLSSSFWYLLGVITLFTLGNSSDAFLLLRARNLGLATTDLYLIWALLHVVKSALATPAGALSDRVPRRWLIGSGWLVYGLVYLGFGGATATSQVWCLFAIYGIYFGLVEGTERALVADLVPASVRGAAFGWYNAATGIAAFPASALFGLLWKWRGPEFAFGFGAALALIAAVLLWCRPVRPPQG
jgi:MFS family permease